MSDGPTPPKLLAITLNGAIVVQSEEDRKKREERRKQRRSRQEITFRILIANFEYLIKNCRQVICIQTKL